jgi:hypothetical protein
MNIIERLQRAGACGGAVEFVDTLIDAGITDEAQLWVVSPRAWQEWAAQRGYSPPADVKATPETVALLVATLPKMSADARWPLTPTFACGG